MARHAVEVGPPEVHLSDRDVMQDLVEKYDAPCPKFWLAVAVAGGLFALGIIAFLVRALDKGLSDSVRNEYGYYAAAFAFLIVTATTAPLAAIAFRWTKNHWRRSFSRASEMFSLVGILAVVAFIPLLIVLPGIDLNGDGFLELGKDRRTIWFSAPIGAPIWWDMAGLVGVAVCGLAILWVSARPDMAQIAQVSSGLRARLMGRLACGWQGTVRDWNVQKGQLALLGAFYFMLLVWVHTLISLDFALSLIPGWRDSIFAAHHVLTGIQASAGLLIVVLFLMKKVGGYDRYIGLDPFWSFAKVLLGLTLLWGYFWFSEFMTFWYGRDETEQSVIKLLMVESYRTPFLLNLFFSFVIPFALLLWNGVRKSVIGPTIAGASALIGAFFMMVRLYVPAFNIKDVGAESIAEFEAAHGSIPAQLLPVLPDLLDVLMVAGMLGGAAFIFLLGTRLIPLMSVWEMKEGLMYILYRPFMKGKYMVLGKPE